MSTYVIGDVQGCYNSLLQLLDKIGYDEAKDVLWFTGDLVNRGKESLQVLRFVKHLKNKVVVLGNHDLTLLALAYTDLTVKEHTLDEILAASDRQELLEWLRYLPLIFHDPISNRVLVHAGIPPAWSLTEACNYAKETETHLQSSGFQELLRNIYGNQPTSWSEELCGFERYRYIINALTRMRFCDQNGNLDFKYKGTIQSAPSNLLPWFQVQNRKTKNNKICFGHWAALQGKTDDPNVYALDTGCIWGGSLSALRVEDDQLFSVSCGSNYS